MKSFVGCRRYKRVAPLHNSRSFICFKTKLRKGKFIFAVAKRVGHKARRDNFRATVQATTRIGILVPLCVYACMPCTSRAICSCVCWWARVCVSSQSSMDAPDCLVGRYDGYTTGSTVMHMFTVIISRGTSCPYLLSCPVLFFASAFVSSRS